MERHILVDEIKVLHGMYVSSALVSHPVSYKSLNIFMYTYVIVTVYIAAGRTEVLHKDGNLFSSRCSLKAWGSQCLDNVLTSDKARPHDSSEGLTNLVSLWIWTSICPHCSRSKSNASVRSTPRQRKVSRKQTVHEEQHQSDQAHPWICELLMCTLESRCPSLNWPPTSADVTELPLHKTTGGERSHESLITYSRDPIMDHQSHPCHHKQEKGHPGIHM